VFSLSVTAQKGLQKTEIIVLMETVKWRGMLQLSQQFPSTTTSYCFPLPLSLTARLHIFPIWVTQTASKGLSYLLKFSSVQRF